MSAALFRAADLNRILGPARLLRTTPRWLLRQTYLVLARDLRAPISRMSRLEFMEWSVFRPAQAPLIRAMNPALSEAEIRRRLAAGQTCLLFWHDGAPVYYRWDTTRPAYLSYLSTTFRPLPGDLFTVEAFTRPAFRGQGIHSLATSMVLQQAAAAGLSRSVTMVAWWNRPALRVTHEKAERGVAGIASRWGFGPWRRYHASGAVRFEQDQILALPAPGCEQGSNGMTCTSCTAPLVRPSVP